MKRLGTVIARAWRWLDALAAELDQERTMAKDHDVYTSGMRGSEKRKQGPLRSVNLSRVYDPPKPRVFEKLDDALAAIKKEVGSGAKEGAEK